MAVDPRQGHSLRFGLFQLNPSTGELLRGGRRVRLQEQPFKILMLLLERPGEVVTRDELRERLWPAGTFVDFEDGLHAAVKRLRSTLGDSSENPTFIETIPRRGYRFIAPVVVETAERTATAPGSEISPGAASGAGRLRLSTVAVILAFAAVPVIFYSASPARRTAAGAPRVVPVTTFPGNEHQPAFSPDGSRLAFVWDAATQERNHDIYIKVLDAPTTLRLTTHPRADLLPAWSPDGQRLAFVRNLAPDRYDILVIPAVGGPEQRIASFFIVDDLDWSPDGNELAIARRNARDAPAAIVLVRLATREVRQLTSPSVSRGDQRVAFSPDGRTLAFTRRSPNAMGIYVVPASGGEARQVLTEPGGIHDLSWTSDGRHIVFSSGPGRAALWRVPARGGAREPLSSAGDSIRWFSIARSGDRIAFNQLTDDINIWQFTPGDDSSAGTTRALVASTWLDTAADPSPDGRKLAFVSDRSGTMEIWTCDADGKNAIALTSFGGTSVGTPHWSPDGRRIAFSAYPQGLSDVFLVDAEGGPPRPLVNDPWDDIAAGWSADGRWVYFASNRTGRREIWKVPAAGGGARRVTHDGGFQAAESADGRTLFFSKGDAPGIWKVPVAGGAAELVVDDFKPGFWGGWRLMPDGLYFLADGSPRTIRFFSFRTRRQTRVITLDRTPDYWGGAFTVFPDRRRILVSLLDQEGSDIKLLENFR